MSVGYDLGLTAVTGSNPENEEVHRARSTVNQELHSGVHDDASRAVSSGMALVQWSAVCILAQCF